MGQLLSTRYAFRGGIRPFKPKYAFNPSKMVKTAVAQDIESVIYPEEPSVEVQPVHYTEEQAKLLNSPVANTTPETSSISNTKKAYRNNLKITPRTVNRV